MLSRIIIKPIPPKIKYFFKILFKCNNSSKFAFVAIIKFQSSNEVYAVIFLFFLFSSL